jgi:hypothetical protein
MKGFVVPAALATVAALLIVALAAFTAVPATSAEQAAADGFTTQRGAP